MTAYPVLGGPNTDIEEFKRFARRMQAESNRANETISLTVPTVTGDRTFGVVVESEGYEILLFSSTRERGVVLGSRFSQFFRDTFTTILRSM